MRKGELSNPNGLHLNERTFHRYEPFLAEVISHWPKAQRFVPSGVSIATFSARIRDAANAFVHLNLPSKLLPDREDFISKWDLVQVQPRRDCVIVGMPEAAPPNSVDLVPREQKPYLFEVTNPTVPQLQSISFLIYTKAITEPVLLLGQIPGEVKLYVGTSIESLEDGNHLIL